MEDHSQRVEATPAYKYEPVPEDDDVPPLFDAHSNQLNRTIQNYPASYGQTSNHPNRPAPIQNYPPTYGQTINHPNRPAPIQNYPASYGQIINSHSSYAMEHQDYPGSTEQLVTAVQPQPDWLGLSIFVTVCCCLPLGIAAIIFSVETRNANRQRDYAEARKSSSKAKVLSLVGLGLGIAASITFGVIYGVSLHNMNHY